ncbi:hypothetical protein OH76DRAFT_1322515, partial [Lentinus brumalis]
VPVVLGPRLPRHDRSPDERENWARIMLMLFLPWRHPHDLKLPNESWIDAYMRQQYRITPAHHSIIRNMNVLSECRDARDKARMDRR